jgi:excisionase family DNA binding protein
MRSGYVREPRLGGSGRNFLPIFRAPFRSIAREKRPDQIMAAKIKKAGANLTVEEVARKLGKPPETVRRMLRTGKLAGEKIGDKGEWRVPTSSLPTSSRPTSSLPTSSLKAKPPTLSRHDLSHIADWAVFPKGIPDQVVREMLRQGFFRKAIVLYELDRAEAVARQILEEAKNESPAVDASLIAEAKRILSIRHRSPGD